MKEARIRSRKRCLGHKEMSLFHVTRFLECPSLGKGKTGSQDDTQCMGNMGKVGQDLPAPG